MAVQVYPGENELLASAQDLAARRKKAVRMKFLADDGARRSSQVKGVGVRFANGVLGSGLLFWGVGVRSFILRKIKDLTLGPFTHVVTHNSDLPAPH